MLLDSLVQYVCRSLRLSLLHCFEFDKIVPAGRNPVTVLEFHKARVHSPAGEYLT